MKFILLSKRRLKLSCHRKNFSYFIRNVCIEVWANNTATWHEALQMLDFYFRSLDYNKPTHIHNYSYNLYNLAPYTTHVMGVNFIHDCRNLQKINHFSWQFYLLYEFLAECCWRQVTNEIIFYIPFKIPEQGFEPLLYLLECKTPWMLTL